jgi:hypothetical protein
MNATQARIRSAATMVGLVALLLIGVVWAWSAVTEPFPEDEEAVTCDLLSVSKGEKVYPDQVTVSVLNAGNEEGLANRTMAALVKADLVEGELGNAPEDAEVSRVQIWTDDEENPAVRLVASFLGKDVKVVLRDPPLPGVNVVVGDDFTKVTKGRKSVAAQEDTTICGPSTEEL